MVVFVDLEEDVQDLDIRSRAGAGIVGHGTTTGSKLNSGRFQAPEETSDDRRNPNINGFSAALSCYP